MIKYPVSPRYCLALSMLGLVLIASGCSSGGAFPTAQTTGVVLCQGQPVANAFVYFEPLEKPKGEGFAGKAAFGRTDDSGRFVLTTYDEGDGAVVGRHRIRVDGSSKSCPCRLSASKDVQEVEVVSGKNDFKIELPLPTAEEKRQMANQREEEEDEEE